MESFDEKKIEKIVEKPKYEKPKQKSKLELTINDTKGLLNGVPYNCYPAPFQDQYRTWIPLEVLQEFLGEDLKVNGNKITIERSI